MLARRLYGGSAARMDYSAVATAVFTPVEYGCVGLSEEAAHAEYGAENVETYLTEWSSLEAGAAHRVQTPYVAAASEARSDGGEAAAAEAVDPWAMPLEASPGCLAKLVCLRSEGERVVGFHFVGPHAGEVTQGYALALKVRRSFVLFASFVVLFAHLSILLFVLFFCSLALKLGATKADFDATVGIHPTDAEAFVQMDVTRSSGAEWVAAGGCGGGKCG